MQVFSNMVFTSTHQYYVQSGDDQYAWEEAFRRQRNGILGGALPGRLTIASGVHTGYVHLSVALVNAPPLLTAEWEDVVEVSFRPVMDGLIVADGETDEMHELSLPVDDYRVRLSVRGMDDGEALITLEQPSEEVVEFHELTFWRALPADDEVSRQGSQFARRQHTWAQTLS